jgi:hypothetical protein
MGVTNSITQARAQAAERAASFSFIPEIYLHDGETAFVRFLSKGDGTDQGFGTARVHFVERTSKKGKKYTQPVYCPKEDDSQCTLCEQGEATKAQLAIWCYVHYIRHLNQNPALANDKDAEAWREIKTPGGSTFFLEDVKRVQLFRKGFGQGAYIFEYFVQHFDNHGVLNDRWYTITRKGASMQDTSYAIMPVEIDDKHPRELMDEERAAMALLPPIDAVFRDQVSYDNRTGEFKLKVEDAVVSEGEVDDDAALTKDVDTTSVPDPVPDEKPKPPSALDALKRHAAAQGESVSPETKPLEELV